MAQEPDTADTKLIDELNEALALEYQAAIQYRQHYINVRTDKRDMHGHFLEHEQDEWEHAKRLADHIQAMGGEPTIEPAELASFTDDLHAAMRQDLEGERVAISDYKDLVELCEQLGASETQLIVEDIIMSETEHLNDLADALRENSREAGVFNLRAEALLL